MKKNLGRILAAAAFALLIAALAFVYVTFGEKAVSGSKSVTLEVISSAAEKTTYTLKTDAEYLSQAMDEAEGLTYVAEEGPYGLSVSSVNGETADFNADGKVNRDDMMQLLWHVSFPDKFPLAVEEQEQPEPTEPEPTEPELTEPEVTEPEITEPELTEPETTEPDPTEATEGST